MKRKLDTVEEISEHDGSDINGDDEDIPKKKCKKSSTETEDFFKKHVCFEADNEFIKRLQGNLQLSKKLPITLTAFNDSRTSINWRNSEKCSLEPDDLDLRNFGLSPKLCSNYEALMVKSGDAEHAWMSASLYQIIGRYMDVCMVSNSNFYSELICLHALNHITRTRRLVIHNKQILESLKEKGGVVKDEQIEKCRDQGLTRPKVLILCPFRKHAFDLVQILIRIMFGNTDRPFVSNLTKFKDEFSDNENRVHEKRKVAEDYKELMSGNIDDCFRLGIGLAKKCLKLYTHFEDSDILLCSPVGLRMIIGDEETEGTRQFDFLSSIELVIVEKAHILFMQNWEHLMNIFDSLNKMPSKITSDISRVRHWAMQDYGRYYRQSLIFSEINFVEMHALAARYCKNYAGEVSIVQNSKSLLPEINVPIVQGIFRLPGTDPQTQSDERFQFFITKILPKCEPHTLIFVPSYFDFVRVRNYLKRDGESFAQVHEYAKKGKVAKARNMFFNSQRKLLILTERFHFYFRYPIKGIKSLVFYQLPMNPVFYTEFVNYSRMYAEKQRDTNFKIETRIIFSKFDVIRMQNVFGNAAVKRLLNAENEFFAIVGE